MKYPKVSIISINYNNAALTCDMIQSLENCTYPNIEIIIVDNASPNEPPDLIEEKYPHIRLIKLKENLGFAGGNNEGVCSASGDYVLLLNNDTEVDPGFLEPLVDLFLSNSEIGMISPKIIYYDSDEIIQFAGSNGINQLTGRGTRIGHGERDVGQFDKVYETKLAHGAALMIPMEVIKKVGLMPDLFFLYYEEHDWCEMVKRSGYKIFYAGTSKIYHKESMSVGKNSPMRTYYMARNRLIYIRRNSFGLTRIGASLFYLLISVPKNLLKHLLKGEFSLYKNMIRGVFWNFYNLKVRKNPQLIIENNGLLKIEGACKPHKY